MLSQSPNDGKRITRLLNSRIRADQRVTMVALIERGGRLCSIGINDYDRKAYPYKELNGYKEGHGLHAELDAIIKCRKDKLKGATIQIMGTTFTGKHVYSKPCKSCRCAIKAVGIKRIVWYDINLKEYKEKL